MPRPRRAAATRASGALSKQTPSRNDTTPAAATALPPAPRPHRSSAGSSKRAALSLARRRAEFERLAAHYLSVSHASASQISPLSSSLVTDLASEKSGAVDDDIQLTPSFAELVLEEQDVEKRDLLMRSIVHRLRKIDQRGEEGETTSTKDDNLKGLAEVLSGQRFLSHEAQRVRLLAACALAELFRISAPDPLVSAQRLDDVCGLFMEQLAVLVVAQDDMGIYRFSLLEQLANVKIFVIFSEDEGVICELFALFYAIARTHQGLKVREYMAAILVGMLEEEEQVAISVLDAMLAPLVPALKYSASAVALAKLVLRLGVKAVQMALCSLLNASIRHSRKFKSGFSPDKPKRRGRKRKQVDESGGEEDEVSEHHEQIAELLVAINKIAPDVLIYVIPSLEDRIRATDEAVRWANVHLLSRLFASRRDMVDSYPSLFDEFLSRIRDVSPTIRAEICESLIGLMNSQPKHRKKLDELLSERLLDREEEVRVVAVRVVGESVNFASDGLLKLMSSRLRDRKPSVRSEALKQLSDLYNSKELITSPQSSPSHEVQSQTHRSEPTIAIDEDGNADSNDEVASDDLTKMDEDHTSIISVKKSKRKVGSWLPKLTWLPQTLMQAHVSLRSAGDASSANEIEQVIFEKIPGVTSGDAEVVRMRLRRFATFLAGLDEQAFNHVALLAQERQKCRESLQRISSYRLQSRKRPQTSSNTSSPLKKTFSKRKQNRSPSMTASVPKLDAAELRALSRGLARFFKSNTGGQDNIQNLCTSFATAVDLKIYERLFSALDGSLPYSQRLASCQDILSRLGSRTDVGEFFEGQVFRKCRPGVFTTLHVAVACEIAIEENRLISLREQQLESQRTKNFPLALCGVLRYLDLTSMFFPNLLEESMESVKSLVNVDLKASDCSSDVILMGLKMASRIPTKVRHDESMADLDCALRRWMLSKSLFDVGQGANMAKWSARAAIRLHMKNSEEIPSSFLQELVQDARSEVNEFKGNIERFIAPLTTLTQLAKHGPKVFEPIALECFDFARALLCGSFNGGLRSYLRENAKPEGQGKKEIVSFPKHSFLPSKLGEEACSLPDITTDFSRACVAELIHRAVKLLVYAFAVIDSAADELKDVFKALLHVLLEKDGDIFSVSESESEDSSREDDLDHESNCKESMVALFARSRLSAGRGMLYLARHPKYFRQFTPSLLVSTILLAQDEQPYVRMTFASAVVHQILKKKLPFRWIVALPLMAVDPVRENVVRIRSLLTAAFRNRRSLFERAKLEGRPSCVRLLPEAVVPEFVWVLANLPDIGLDQEQKYRESEKCLDLLLDRLLESNEYAGVLNEFIESLLISQDVSEVEEEGRGEKSQRMYAIARIAGSLLKRKQSGKKWNLSHHPGDISLPTDMFRVINRESETSGVPPPSLVDVARMYDDEQVRSSGKKGQLHDTAPLFVNVTPAKSHSTGENSGRAQENLGMLRAGTKDEASPSTLHSVESREAKTTRNQKSDLSGVGSGAPRPKQGSPRVESGKAKGRGTRRRITDSVVVPSSSDKAKGRGTNRRSNDPVVVPSRSDKAKGRGTKRRSTDSTVVPWSSDKVKRRGTTRRSTDSTAVPSGSDKAKGRGTKRRSIDSTAVPSSSDTAKGRGKKMRSSESVVFPSSSNEPQPKQKEAEGLIGKAQPKDMQGLIAQRTRPVSQQLKSKTRKNLPRESKPSKVVQSVTVIEDAPKLRRSSRFKRT